MIDTASDKLIHIDEIARRFSITYQTVRKWITDGKLEAIRVGASWYTTDAAINDYVRRAAQEEIDRTQTLTEAANQSPPLPWTRAGKVATANAVRQRQEIHAANLAQYKAARNRP